VNRSAPVGLAVIATLSGAVSALAEDYPFIADRLGSPPLEMYPLVVRPNQATTGTRDGGSESGFVPHAGTDRTSVPSTGFAFLQLSASWCAPCVRHVALVSKAQEILSSHCNQDQIRSRVMEVTQGSILGDYRNPTRGNERVRRAWAESTHDVAVIPTEKDGDFNRLLGVKMRDDGPGASPLPSTVVILNGRIVSLHPSGGAFTGEIPESADMTDARRTTVRTYNAKRFICNIQAATAGAAASVGAPPLSCDFDCAALAAP